MSLAKTWYTVAEAESKFGVPKNRFLKWVEDGLVRCELEGGKIVSVNGDDIELRLEEYVKKG